MTIHRGWLVYFKSCAPHAFTAKQPFPADAVFIDGQIKLMKQQDTSEWTAFFRQQFLWPINRFFKGGAHTVVLAFDNYTHVPRAKSMTQQKRNTTAARQAPLFVEGNDLPSVPPADWGAYMRNRAFKRKVIHEVVNMLVTRAPRMLPGQLIIVDYEDALYYIRNCAGAPPEEPPLCRRYMHGEADVKFPDYSCFFKRTLLDAVDGDYVPIALIARELHSDVHMCVRRIRIRAEGDDEPASTGRQYEYVDIDTLYRALRRVFRTHVRLPPSHAGHEMRMLAVLIGTSGTDFTQPAPRITPQLMTKHLTDTLPLLVDCYDPSTHDALDLDAYANRLLSTLYRRAFAKHTEGARGMHAVHASLQRASISAGTKRKIPDSDTATCFARNINWLLHYWQPTHGKAPEAIQPKYGFVEDKRTGVVDWDKRI